MDLFKLAIARKIGKIFALAATNRKYNCSEFVHKWLASETYQSVIDFETYICSQSRDYILSVFEEENKEHLPTIDENSKYLEDAMWWLGYIVTYWFFLDGTTGPDILRDINIDKVLSEYDVLHTLDVRLAIEKIKEDDAL